MKQELKTKTKEKIPSDQLSTVLLKNAFFKKQAKNSNYSLRAFAKSLGVSHTVLSLIFSGKRKISPKLASKVVDKLDLNYRQQKLFLAEHTHAITGSADTTNDYEVNQIDLDQFSMISEWQHYAILSLLETNDFKMDYSWIAKRLNISQILVKTSVERLFRLKLLVKNSEGKWVQSGGTIRINNKKSTTATRKFHQQLIKKGYDSLNNDPIEIRNHTSVTFTMNPKDIPYAMEKIREFKIKLARELEHMTTREEVYNLCLQLYPVSRRS